MGFKVKRFSMELSSALLTCFTILLHFPMHFGCSNKSRQMQTKITSPSNQLHLSFRFSLFFLDLSMIFMFLMFIGLVWNKHTNTSRLELCTRLSNNPFTSFLSTNRKKILKINPCDACLSDLIFVIDSTIEQLAIIRIFILLKCVIIFCFISFIILMLMYLFSFLFVFFFICFNFFILLFTTLIAPHSVVHVISNNIFHFNLYRFGINCEYHEGMLLRKWLLIMI